MVATVPPMADVSSKTNIFVVRSRILTDPSVAMDGSVDPVAVAVREVEVMYESVLSTVKNWSDSRTLFT